MSDDAARPAPGDVEAPAPAPPAEAAPRPTAPVPRKPATGDRVLIVCMGVAFGALLVGSGILAVGWWAPGLFSGRAEPPVPDAAPADPAPASAPLAAAPPVAPAPRPAAAPAPPRSPLDGLPLDRVVDLLTSDDARVRGDARARLVAGGPAAVEALLDRLAQGTARARALQGETDQLRAALEGALAQVAEERRRREEAAAQHGAARVAELYQQASEAAARGEHGRARVLCDAAVGLQPDHVGARGLRARSALALGAFADAVDDFTAAATLDPGYAAHHRGLGQALLGLRDWTGAKAAFGRALALDAGDAAAVAGREAADEALRAPAGGGE